MVNSVRSGTFIHKCAFPFLAGQRLEQEQSHGKEESLMRNYELVCIIHPDLDETAFKEAVEMVKGWITEAGGSVGKEDMWGKRKLAYLIQKQREGQYVLLHITLSPDATQELERKIRFLEPVMRHMLTVV
jgi:small subunit ribosomal protein S6